MRGVIHTRVSTRDGRQDTENQRLQLQRFCGAQGWEIVREYLGFSPLPLPGLVILALAVAFRAFWDHP
jgi:hypothetical protein